jgi:hypothetical protein
MITQTPVRTDCTKTVRVACRWCLRRLILRVPLAQYAAWLSAKLKAVDAFPNLSTENCEFVDSGLCTRCRLLR